MFAKNIKSFLLLFSICLLPMKVSANELIAWGEHMTQDFSVDQCVTIPGTPGVPKHCAPSTRVNYPCPSIKHPKKKCHHTISGPCTPAIPGTHDKKTCVHKGFGKLSVKVDGGVHATSDGVSDNNITVSNTVSVDLFGQHVVIPMSCTMALGTKTSICMNVLANGALVFDNKSGVSCEISGSDIKSISYPGVTANVCLDADIDTSKKTPKGLIGIRVESAVDFGHGTLMGHSVSLGRKSWNPTLFQARF